MTIVCCSVSVPHLGRLLFVWLCAMFCTALQFCVASTHRILAVCKSRGFLRVCFLRARLPVAAQRHVALLHTKRSACSSPNASFQPTRLGGLHLCGLLAAGFLGLAKTLLRPNGARSADYFSRALHANTPSCVYRVSTSEPQGSSVAGFLRGMVQLSSLREPAQKCSPSIAQKCRRFQPKSLPFGAPLNGLYHGPW